MRLPFSSEPTLNRKIIYLFSIFIILICGIAVRLFHLQVHLKKTFVDRSVRNYMRYEPIVSLRGNIIDIHGKLLATNKSIINAYWKGTGNARLTPEQQQSIKDFTLLVSEKNIPELNDILLAERQSREIALCNELNFEQLGKIVERFGTDHNICVKTVSKRFYPHGTLACHILGYLGHLNVASEGGKMGMEKLFEPTLRGKSGSLMRIINSFGKNLHEEELLKAELGGHVRTTIDLDLQKVAEAVFPEDKSGSLILMDPTDGSIRVLISRPSFDPNLFSQTMQQDAWSSLSEQRSFLNRVCNSCYPPGSIFKLVTLSVALEKGIFDQYSHWRCSGFTRLGTSTFKCHNKLGHGVLNTQQAIAKSCNIPFFEIAKRISIDDIAQYATKFGLGKPTNIAFREHTGLIPTRAWKRITKGERWWQGETFSASIGQSFLLVTPIQIARMLSAIETGYLVAPRMTENTMPEYEPLTLRRETRLFLKKVMRSVVDDGTAHRLSSLKDFIIHAKTSTAQTSHLSKKKLGDEFLEHGWLAINFSYRGEHPLTLVVLVEKCGGPSFAITATKSFLRAYATIINEREKGDGFKKEITSPTDTYNFV